MKGMGSLRRQSCARVWLIYPVLPNDGISEHLTTAKVISRAGFWGLLLPLWAFRSRVLTGLEKTHSENLVKLTLAQDSVTEISSK